MKLNGIENLSHLQQAFEVCVAAYGAVDREVALAFFLLGIEYAEKRLSEGNQNER